MKIESIDATLNVLGAFEPLVGAQGKESSGINYAGGAASEHGDYPEEQR